MIGNAGVSDYDDKYIKDNRMVLDVVRFNNFATREKIRHTEYSYECDILFSTLDLRSAQDTPRDIVIGIPFPFKAERNKLIIERDYSNSNAWMVDPYSNMDMNKELETKSLGFEHPFPSVGFTALWHMRNWNLPMYVCGFNWYNEGNKFQGWDISKRNYPSNWNHNYCREILWIHDNLLNKLNIKFSPECERLLILANRLSKR